MVVYFENNLKFLPNADESFDLDFNEDGSESEIDANDYDSETEIDLSDIDFQGADLSGIKL